MGFLFYKFKLAGLCSLWLFVTVLGAGNALGQDPVSSPSPSLRGIVTDRDLSCLAELPDDPPPVHNFAHRQAMPSTVGLGL